MYEMLVKEYKGTVPIQTEKFPLVKHNLGGSKVKLPHVFHRGGTLPAPTPVKKDVVVDVPSDEHETNKTAWMMGAAGLGWWLFR